MKLVPWLLWMALLAAIAACGPSATPTTPPPTPIQQQPTIAPITPPPNETQQQPTVAPATPRPPATAAPTATVASTTTEEPPPTATPPPAAPAEPPRLDSLPLPIVEIPLTHPAALLAVLPAGTTQFMFANIETVLERPVFEEIFEYGLMDFVDDEKSPSEELLRSSAVNALILGHDREFEWSCILSGDFMLMQNALELATTMPNANPFTELVEERRGIRIFGVFLDDGYHPLDELYLAMPNRDTLVLTKDLDRMREMVERRLDGGSLPEPLAVMLEDWGLPDYLFVSLQESGSDSQDRPTAASRLYAFHATLSEGETTTLRGLRQFDDEEQAAIAVTWLQEQTNPRFRRLGWGDYVSIDEWRQKGSTVYAEVTVPDEDLPNLVQGN